MREADNIREVEALGIDLMGFIFWPKSKRYVAEPPQYLPTQVKKVGVFVDATLEDVRQHIQVHLLHVLTSWLQILTWIEVSRMLSQVLTDYKQLTHLKRP